MINQKDVLHIASNQIEKEYSSTISLEHRKKFAQFFTPYKLASLMVDWVLGNKELKSVLEPAYGLGVFTRVLLRKKNDVTVKGFEVDETILSVANDIFCNTPNLKIHKGDYMFNDWNNKYDGVICNPPYFKFHDYNSKPILDEVSKHLGIKLNGFTNLYALFLLKSIYQLNQNGRLSYLIPLEFLNSDYGKLIKAELIRKKVLRHIIIFDFEEAVFDDALTTSCILLCSKDKFHNRVKFTSINKVNDMKEVETYISEYPQNNNDNTTIYLKHLDPEVKWRKYYQEQNGHRYKNLIPFSSVAKVVRGIATGANEYFIFSKSKANEFGIDEKYLLPCICKSADVKGNFFTKDDFNSLVNSDRNAFLLNAIGSQDENVSKYIELGKTEGIDKKYLTASRTPWYSLENRPPSPIWVSVFNRNGLKFIRNEANISNLTTFHCVYPVQSNLFFNVDIDILFAYLLTDVAREIFEDNRREYGNGLQKFEPNDLNNAMMLDLTLLDKSSKYAILELYRKYRDSVVNKIPVESLLLEINDIFKSKYSNVK